MRVPQPRAGEKLVDVAEAQAEDVDRAVQAAKKVGRHPWQVEHQQPAFGPQLLPNLSAFLHCQAYDNGPWPRMTAAARGRVLTRLADIIEVRLKVEGGSLTSLHLRSQSARQNPLWAFSLQERCEELALLESLDSGKTLTQVGGGWQEQGAQ